MVLTRAPGHLEVLKATPLVEEHFVVTQSGAFHADLEADAARGLGEAVISPTQTTESAHPGNRISDTLQEAPTAGEANAPNLLRAAAQQDQDQAEIVVSGDSHSRKIDPLARVNEISYDAVQIIDKNVVGPTAKTWERVMPAPGREGLRNFLTNLSEPVNLINNLLQFNIDRAFQTIARFGINTTLGVGGLFDIAKREPFRLPYRQNGFANTFGYHGIKPGPYLFVPLVGPTTVRDLIGRVLDLSVLPNVVGRPFNTPVFTVGNGVVKSLNDRIEIDLQLKMLRESANPYAATRRFYFERRQTEINALHSAAYRQRKGISGAAPSLPRL